MRDRDAPKRNVMASNDPRDWAKYRKLLNTINNNIKISKTSYFSNAFSQSKSNSRKTWQTINEVTSRRTNNTTMKELQLNGSIISNSSEPSHAFNDHFSIIGLHLANEATDNQAFNIDRGDVNAVVFLDLKKVFDTVDHDILLSKMNLYGIQGIGLDKSYTTMSR